MPLTKRRFQNLLIGIPFLFYVAFAAYLAYELRREDLPSIFAALFFMALAFCGLPFVIALIVHLPLRKWISTRGAFIIVHWLILILVLSGAVALTILNSINNTTSESEWKVHYDGEKGVVDSLATEFAQNKVLKNKQHFHYFKNISALAGSSDAQYLVDYYYNLQPSSDSESISVVSMQVNKYGKVLKYKVKNVYNHHADWQQFNKRLAYLQVISTIVHNSHNAAGKKELITPEQIKALQNAVNADTVYMH